MAYLELKIVAGSMPELADQIAHANAQFAALAASRNAISLAPDAAATSFPADSTGGSEALPADEPVSQPGVADSGDMTAGKEGNGAPEAGTEEVEQAASDPEPASDVTYDDVRAAVTKLAASKGREAALGVLDTFGVDHGSKLTEGQWSEAVAALTAALEG